MRRHAVSASRARRTFCTNVFSFMPMFSARTRSRSTAPAIRAWMACLGFVGDLIFGYGRPDGASPVARATMLPARWRPILFGPIARWLPRLSLPIMAATGLEVLIFGW